MFTLPKLNNEIRKLVNLIERSVKRYTKVASLNVQFSRKHF